MEKDAQNMAGQTYEWIGIDAYFEWVAAIAFDQKDYMWVSQLDVVAQYEVRVIRTCVLKLVHIVVGNCGLVEDTKPHYL